MKSGNTWLEFMRALLTLCETVENHKNHMDTHENNEESSTGPEFNQKTISFGEDQSGDLDYKLDSEFKVGKHLQT